jgi:hypothetical protein
MRRLTIILTALLLTLALAVPAAAAKPIAREHYEGSVSGIWDDCLPGIEFEGSWHGNYLYKAGDPPFVQDNYEWDWVNRNPANDKYFTEHGQGLYKDLKATHLYGTVYHFVAQESGSIYTIETADGTKVLFDRGLLRYEFDADTKGDLILENNEYVGDVTIAADRGVHQFVYMTPEEYCALVVDLLGD